jgi:hypothetical protein
VEAPPYVQKLTESFSADGRQGDMKNTYYEHALWNAAFPIWPVHWGAERAIDGHQGFGRNVYVYPCAFHVGKWEPDESVEDAYRRALNITDDQLRRMQRDDDSALAEKHAAAIDRMYRVAALT